MRISVSQIYIRPGVNFPFSHLFQRWISEELTAIVRPSDEFIRDFGNDFTLVFNLSAKADIHQNEIKGPTIFKETKDVEFTIFVPYDTIDKSGNSTARALRFFLDGTVNVFEALGIDANEVSKRMESMIQHVCSDASMIKKSGDTKVP
jgi:hypothetical protein